MNIDTFGDGFLFDAEDQGRQFWKNPPLRAELKRQWKNVRWSLMWLIGVLLLNVFFAVVDRLWASLP